MRQYNWHTEPETRDVTLCFSQLAEVLSAHPRRRLLARRTAWIEHQLLEDVAYRLAGLDPRTACWSAMRARLNDPGSSARLNRARRATARKLVQAAQALGLRQTRH